MNSTPIHLLPALRQYRHNDSPEFLMGYDCTEANKVYKVLQDSIAELESHIQSLKVINQYIDEGCPDISVVRSEIGEVISRSEGTYFKAPKEQGE